MHFANTINSIVVQWATLVWWGNMLAKMLLFLIIAAKTGKLIWAIWTIILVVTQWTDWYHSPIGTQVCVRCKYITFCVALANKMSFSWITVHSMFCEPCNFTIFSHDSVHKCWCFCCCICSQIGNFCSWGTVYQKIQFLQFRRSYWFGTFVTARKYFSDGRLINVLPCQLIATVRVQDTFWLTCLLGVEHFCPIVFDLSWVSLAENCCE